MTIRNSWTVTKKIHLGISELFPKEFKKKKSKFLDFGTKSYNSISQNTKKTSKTHVKTQQISKWVLMDGTKTPPKKKNDKNQVFWEEITFGFLGISSGSCRISRSSDHCARRRRIGTHHRRKDKQNKKRLCFFFLLCFSQI